MDSDEEAELNQLIKLSAASSRRPSSDTAIVPSAGTGGSRVSADPFAPLPGAVLALRAPRRAIDVDEDEDDEDDETQWAMLGWAAKRKKVEAPVGAAPDRSGRLNVPSAPYVPSDEEVAHLDQIRVPWQRHLQRLLFWLGCHASKYSLMPHQFESALMCAGIAGPWPPADLTTPEMHALLASPYRDPSASPQGAARRDRLAALLPDPTPTPPGGRRSGCLLGDVMGLGKTVSAIAGLVLREFVVLLQPDAVPEPRELSSLVVCPNDIVLQQWLQHLSAAGVPSNQVLEIRGRPFPSPLATFPSPLGLTLPIIPCRCSSSRATWSGRGAARRRRCAARPTRASSCAPSTGSRRSSRARSSTAASPTPSRRSSPTTFASN